MRTCQVAATAKKHRPMGARLVMITAILLHVAAEIPQDTAYGLRGMARRLANELDNATLNSNSSNASSTIKIVTSTTMTTTAAVKTTTLVSTSTEAATTSMKAANTSTEAAAIVVMTSTTTTVPAVALAVGGGTPLQSDSGDDTGMIIGIIASIVVVLAGSAGALAAFWHFRRIKVAKHIEDVRQLEMQEEDYSASVVHIVEKIEAQGGYCDRLRKKKASAEPFTEENHTLYLQSWKDFLVDHQQFLDRFTKALTIRRAAAGQTQSNSKKPRSTVDRVRMNQQQSLFPAFPATPLLEVSEQLKTLQELRTRMHVVLQKFPDLNAELDVKEPPLPSGSNRSSSSNRPRAGTPDSFLPVMSGLHLEKDPQLAEQVAMLRLIAHPLLAQAVVKPYGVLGSSDSQPDPRPSTPVEAVVVDPAGFPYIGLRNNPASAGAASGSIYRWLSIAKVGGFPDGVHKHFSDEYEADTETRAMYHSYGQGQHVIHCVGPKIRELLDGVSDLTRTYVNVLTEFCNALAALEPPPKVLRLLPISSGVFLVNKKLERYMANITWSALSVAFCSLPPSFQEQLKTCCFEVCIFQKKEVKLYESTLKEKMDVAGVGRPKLQQASATGFGPGSLQAKMGGFDWIRLRNGPADRLNRLAGFLVTEQTIWNRGFQLPSGEVVELDDLSAMIKGTCIRKATDRFMVRSLTGLTLDLRGDDAATVMEVAIRCQQEGKKTVAVSAASAYNPGGASLTGGRHALEETWCTMSTLLKSILHAKQDAASSGERGSPGRRLDFTRRHIPVDGCIVSPDVQIFRDTSAFGYSFQAVPTKLLGVVSVAMFNMNPRMNDSPQDAPENFNEYCQQVKQKFIAMTQAAAELGAEVLVCPDIGCGVFENNPTIVGTLLGEALAELPGFFTEVWIVGKMAFFEAARRAASREKVLLERPMYYFTSGGPHECGDVTATSAASDSHLQNPISASSMIVNTGSDPGMNCGDGDEGTRVPPTPSMTVNTGKSGSRL